MNAEHIAGADILVRMDRPDAAPAEASVPPTERVRPSGVYLASGLLTCLVVVLYLQLWGLDWSTPFDPSAGAQLNIVDITLTQGWYHGPDPTSQSSDSTFVANFDHPLHLLSIRLLGLLSGDAAVVLNLLFLLGFPAAALTATAFLRKIGLSAWPTVALATLFALTPFHFLQGQSSLPMAGYWPVPLALCIVLAVLRREPIWTVPTTGSAARAVLTGRAARTTVVLVLTALSGPDITVFVGVLLVVAALLGRARSAGGGPQRTLRGFGAAASALAVLAVVRVLWSSTVAEPTVEQPWGDVAAGSFKFIALILPSPGHPVQTLADLRAGYDRDFWYQSGDAALGLVAALGFLALLLVPVVRAMGPRGPWPSRLDDGQRTALGELSALTWVAFLFGSFGGLAFLDLLYLNATGEVHTWHRISVFLALFGLAAVGIWLDSSSRWWNRRANRTGRARDRELAVQLPMILAVLVFLVGVVDQQIEAASPGTQTEVVTISGGDR